MHNTREKLIELIDEADEWADHKCDELECETCPTNKMKPNCVLQLMIDRLIANGVTVQKWIPVTERLPEVVDDYIVVVKYKYDWEKEYSIDTDVATYNPYEKAYIDDCWNTYNDWNEGQQYLHVTHWMPLPEPPKGE